MTRLEGRVSEGESRHACSSANAYTRAAVVVQMNRVTKKRGAVCLEQDTFPYIPLCPFFAAGVGKPARPESRRGFDKMVSVGRRKANRLCVCAVAATLCVGAGAFFAASPASTTPRRSPLGKRTSRAMTRVRYPPPPRPSRGHILGLSVLSVCLCDVLSEFLDVLRVEQF